MSDKNYDLTNPYEIAKFIKDAKKITPMKAYINGDLSTVTLDNVKKFGSCDSWVLIGDSATIKSFIANNEAIITDYYTENDRRNSAIPTLDLTEINARIEPGVTIRDRVSIGDNAVIMMGAVINIGSEIGEGTMIDMNVVLGARATIGKNAHIGAGTVIAGVLEPPSATPVIIEDGVLIGANAVVIEGVRVGKGAVVAAGAIVTEDVPAGAVVAGNPARVVKQKDAKTESKTEMLDDLRK